MRYFLLSLALFVSIGITVLVAPSTHADPVTFNLTTLDFPGALQTQVFGVNDQGQVVGSYFTVFNGFFAERGFVYSGGTFTTVDFPSPPAFVNSHHTDLLGVNNRGEVVGIIQNSSIGNAWFLLNQGTFTVIGPPGTQASFSVGQIAGINERGDVVAGFFDSSQGQHGFLLRDGQYTTIGSPYASGINNPGEIVGGNSLLSKGQFQAISYPGAAGPTFAMGLNNASEIVGFYSPAPGVLEHGFVLVDGNYTTIDFPGAAQTLIFGVNNSGEIVGTWSDNSGSHGFIGLPISSSK